MRIAASGLIVLATLGCTPQAESTADGPSAVGELSVRSVPKQLEEFRLTETDRFPDPEAGVLYRYRADSALEPDVYLYPLTETARRAGADPQAQARAESELFKQVLQLQRQQGRFESYEVLQDQPLEYAVGTGFIRGWHVHAVIRTRAGERDTHQHLFVLGDQLVKVRTSSWRGTVQQESLSAYLHSLLEGLTAR